MLKLNKIYQGDCLELMQSINDKSIDLIITSPPYNLGIKYGNYKDYMNINSYFYWCRLWLSELFRILKNDGRFALIHYLSCGKAGKRFAPLMNLNYIAEEIGFKHHGIAIWYDITLTKLTAWGSWLSSSAPYINSPFEGIDILYKNKWKRNGEKNEMTKEEFMMACSGIWKISPERNREHPAPFPIKLANLIIKLLSAKNDLILDPFIGSGTTAVACKLLNRNFIGIEINPDYVEMANKRIEDFYKQEELLCQN